MEEEEKNSNVKVGFNATMVKWDQPTIDVCVMARMPGTTMPKEKPLEKEVSFTKG
jgi:hypothetical protein